MELQRKVKNAEKYGIIPLPVNECEEGENYREYIKKIKGWKIPLTQKSFTISYDGTVKAGIKDLTKAEVSQNGDKVIVKLPEVEITGTEIDNDSFEILDESNGVFNTISADDVNDAQKELKKKMEQRAIEKGILDMAKSNAEELVTELLKSPSGEYKVEVEWK